MIYRLIRPLLFRIDPERVHTLAGALLVQSVRIPGGAKLLGSLFAFQHPMLETRCLNRTFENPIGMAAGFDKKAQMVEGLLAMGFGHVEVGTVTPRPQSGNPRPRMFRLPEDGALINRLGFNSPGMDAVAGQLHHTRLRHPLAAIGVNIGKNRDTTLEQASNDYLMAFERLAPFADYVAVNISSPNTPGLRQLHERHALEALLGELSHANRSQPIPKPLLLKISPDESDAQIELVVGVGLDAGFAGFIATNTTLARPMLRSTAAREAGGLSGLPLAARSHAVTKQVAQLSHRRAIVISVGGITTGMDAYARIRSGAQLIQLYSAIVYHGPGIVGRIARELVDCLVRDGFRTIDAAIGVDCTKKAIVV